MQFVLSTDFGILGQLSICFSVTKSFNPIILRIHFNLFLFCGFGDLGIFASVIALLQRLSLNPIILRILFSAFGYGFGDFRIYIPSPFCNKILKSLNLNKEYPLHGFRDFRIIAPVSAMIQTLSLNPIILRVSMSLFLMKKSCLRRSNCKK